MPSLLFPNLKLLLTKINFGLSFFPNTSFIKIDDFVFENFLSNFFIIIKSTFRRFKLSIFCSKLDILKFFKSLLKKNFGIGSKVKTPTFKEYFFLYFFANENNF